MHTRGGQRAAIDPVVDERVGHVLQVLEIAFPPKQLENTGGLLLGGRRFIVPEMDDKPGADPVHARPVESLDRVLQFLDRCVVPGHRRFRPLLAEQFFQCGPRTSRCCAATGHSSARPHRGSPWCLHAGNHRPATGRTRPRDAQDRRLRALIRQCCEADGHVRCDWREARPVRVRCHPGAAIV